VGELAWGAWSCEPTTSADYRPIEGREAVVLDDEVGVCRGAEAGWCPGQHCGGRYQKSETLRDHDVIKGKAKASPASQISINSRKKK
jgi:hypothetical protein